MPRIKSFNELQESALILVFKDVVRKNVYVDLCLSVIICNFLLVHTSAFAQENFANEKFSAIWVVMEYFLVLNGFVKA